MMKTRVSKIGLMVCALVISLTTLVFGSGSTTTAAAQSMGEKEVAIPNNKTEIFSYIDVFRSYYDKVVERAKEVGKSEVCSFEEFCDKYYYCGKN